jgi:hypothetical protein
MVRLFQFTLTLITLLVLSSNSLAQDSASPPPGRIPGSDIDIWETRHRGMELHSYFVAYDVAIEALKKHLGNLDVPPAMGAMNISGKWIFTWGEFVEPYTYDIKYEITIDGIGRLNQFDIFPESGRFDSYQMFAARARAIAIAKYEASKSHYNLLAVPYRVAVIMISGSEFMVYIAPEQQSEDVTLYGGDIRYTVDLMRSWITAIDRYHPTIIPVPNSLQEGTEASYIQTSAPMFSSVDVANTIARNTPVIVSTKTGSYHINASGQVKKILPPGN